METGVLATLLGVALATLVAACGAGFRWLRSDFKPLEERLDRLETEVDNRIMALARSGVLIDSPAAEPGAPPPTAGSPSIARPTPRAPPPGPCGPAVRPAWPAGSRGMAGTGG